MSVFELYHLTLSSVVFSLAAALLGGAFFSVISGILLWITPQQKTSAFVVGFALTCALAISRLAQPMDDWRGVLMFDSLPLLACFTYFLPTMVGISAGRETFNSIFLINLFFGWTGIGWLAAMVMAFRPEEHDIYDDINFRLTPFGAVRRAPIVLGNGAESVVKRIAASSVYVPPLRREV